MKSGIYLIKNIKNNKCYVGQSKNVYNRIKEHKDTMKTKNENRKFNEELNKYNLEDFEFKVLELCEIKELNEKEKYYSNLYDSVENGYNANECGKSKVPIENEKIRNTFYIDKKIYIEFKKYCILKNSNVSKEIEQFMKQEIEKLEKGE